MFWLEVHCLAIANIFKKGSYLVNCQTLLRGFAKLKHFETVLSKNVEML